MKDTHGFHKRKSLLMSSFRFKMNEQIETDPSGLLIDNDKDRFNR